MQIPSTHGQLHSRAQNQQKRSKVHWQIWTGSSPKSQALPACGKKPVTASSRDFEVHRITVTSKSSTQQITVPLPTVPEQSCGVHRVQCPSSTRQKACVQEHWQELWHPRKTSLCTPPGLCWSFRILLKDQLFPVCKMPSSTCMPTEKWTPSTMFVTSNCIQQNHLWATSWKLPLWVNRNRSHLPRSLTQMKILVTWSCTIWSWDLGPAQSTFGQTKHGCQQTKNCLLYHNLPLLRLGA